ncbi:uncharacterized protein ARMOST_18357 [Armillaria ostoyae]|uniref:MYND-type domain-containing protein n=1 Tax=Armillaria ostoyae TaxID=47428 RepID=A0A284S1I7_ARMOS|nr:uncharacterized protein ARMOST_18357 [Armillaria ostoyae]
MVRVVPYWELQANFKLCRYHTDSRLDRTLYTQEEVPYCSPECQKSAWKYGPAPHKAVCRKLRKFCEVLKLPAKPEQVEDSVVDKWCETMGISLDDVVVIKLHFEDLAFSDGKSDSV